MWLFVKEKILSKYFKAISIAGIIFCALSLQISTVSAGSVYVSGTYLVAGSTYFKGKWQSYSTSTPGNISCGESLCYFMLAARSEISGRYAGVNQIPVSMAQGSSWDAIIAKWTDRYGLAGSLEQGFGFLGSDLSICAVLGADATLSDSSRVTVAPGTTCNIIPPAPSECNFMVGDATLSYGNLEPQATDGAISSTSVTVECSKAANVIFKLASGLPTVQLGLGLNAELQVGSKPLGMPVPLQAGQTQIPIASTLRGVAGGTGSFAASTILVIEVL